GVNLAIGRSGRIRHQQQCDSGPLAPYDLGVRLRGRYAVWNPARAVVPVKVDDLTALHGDAQIEVVIPVAVRIQDDRVRRSVSEIEDFVDARAVLPVPVRGVADTHVEIDVTRAAPTAVVARRALGG